MNHHPDPKKFAAEFKDTTKFIGSLDAKGVIHKELVQEGCDPQRISAGMV